MSLAQVAGIWLVSSMKGKKRRERGESRRQREIWLRPTATLPTLLRRSHASHISARRFFLPKLPGSPACLGLLLPVHNSQLRWLPGVPQAAATSALLPAALFLSAHFPTDFKPFLTHRWEAASQPHAVLASIQMLNREEEQFHTPYLAWERRSETAWMLPGKAAWV